MRVRRKYMVYVVFDKMFYLNFKADEALWFICIGDHQWRFSQILGGRTNRPKSDEQRPKTVSV